MESMQEWLISLGIPFGAVVILRGIVTQRVIRYLLANKETISGVVVQGKEVYNVVSEHGPVLWRKIRHYFMKRKGGKAYILCISDSLRELDFVGVFSTVSAPSENRERDIENDNKYAQINELLTTIPVGRYPVGIATNADKSRVYVVSLTERILDIIDPEKDEVIEKITGLRENPGEIAISPDQKKACILHRSSDLNQNSQMTILHLQKQRVYTYTKWEQELSNELQQEELTKELLKKYWEKFWRKEYKQEYVEVGKDPRAIAVMGIEHHGRIYHVAFIANYGDQNITCVNIDHLDDPTQRCDIPVNDYPHHIVLSQKHGLVYVLSDKSMKYINPFNPKAGAKSILEGKIKKPERAVFDQDGRLYITDSGDDTVKIIEKTGNLLAQIKVGSNPQGIAVASEIRSCVGSNNRYIWIACANAGSRNGHWIHLFLMEGESDTEGTPLLEGTPQKKQAEENGKQPEKETQPRDFSLKNMVKEKGYWTELTVKILNTTLENVDSNPSTDPPSQVAQTEIVSDGERVFVTAPNQSEVIYSDPSQIGKAEQTLISLSGSSPFSGEVRATGRAVVLPFDANRTERRCNFLSVFMTLLYGIVAIELLIKIPDEVYTLISEKMQRVLESGTIVIPILFMLMSALSIVALLKMKGKVKLSFVIIAVTLFVAIMILWPLAWAFAVKPPVGYTAYVSDFRGNVILGMDTETNRTTARIEVGAGPDSLAVARGATEICVANWRNDTVSIVDTRRNSVAATISVGNGPRNATMSPDGRQCWVSNQFDQSVSVIDMATKQVVATIAVEEEPGAMSFTVDGAKACVVNVGSGTVSIVDTKTFEVVENNITVGSLPEDIVTDHFSDQQWTYVTSRWNHSVAVIDVKINEQLVKVIPVGGDPRRVALIPERNKLYVSIFNAGIVSVIDTSGDTIIANITVKSGPHILLLSPNHSRLYVANELSSYISVIDTEATEMGGKVIATITGLRNSFLRSMAITSDGSQIYVTYEDSGWISIVDIVDMATYEVRNVQVGISLREVVFVKK
jgi:YVTN family beta-propeller protein